MQNIIGNINGFKDSLVFEVGFMVRVVMVSVVVAILMIVVIGGSVWISTSLIQKQNIRKQM